MALGFEYLKKRSEFGKQPLFCEQGPEMCDSIACNVNEHKNFILRNPIVNETQNTPSFSEHYVNTIRVDYKDSGANHSEGGWPKDVNVTDTEATQRYRRKTEKEEGYIHCVMNASAGMEHYVLQNNAIDLYQTYNMELPSMPGLERISCRTVNVYRDHGRPPRPLSSICWQGDGSSRFAAAYADVDFNRQSRGSIESYIWDIETPLSPELKLEPQCPVLDLQFGIRDVNILAGGLMNGQVCYWDRRKGGIPVAHCAPHTAHRDLVGNVLFINSKTGMEVFSAGPDGCAKWWDLRHLDEPVEEMILDVMKYSFDVPSMATSNGVTALEYEPTLPTRFMAGTENGLVLFGNRKGKTPLEKIPGKIDAHLGPVNSLERNPFFLKNFLTVGDWSAKIWSEECRESPVLWTAPQKHRITAGTWSTGRLSLMMLAQSNGKIALWDLLRSQLEPVLTMQVCDDPLIQLCAHENATHVACGSQNGNIYMVELSHSLTLSEKNDKALLSAIFERENKRERILEARMREIRLKFRQAEEGGSPVVSVAESDPSIGDRDIIDATNEYMATVKKEMAAL